MKAISFEDLPTEILAVAWCAGKSAGSRGNDGPLFEGEVGVDRAGRVLVVQWRPTDQGAPLQGVQGLDDGDQKALDSSGKCIRE